jgi:hypothetical protein
MCWPPYAYEATNQCSTNFAWVAEWEMPLVKVVTTGA